MTVSDLGDSRVFFTTNNQFFDSVDTTWLFNNSFLTLPGISVRLYRLGLSTKLPLTFDNCLKF